MNNSPAHKRKTLNGSDSLPGSPLLTAKKNSKEKQAEKAISREIDESLRKEYEQLEKMKPINKLLILGPGDSGKTTLLKQMKLLHGDGFPSEMRQQFIEIVALNCVDAMRCLIQATIALNVSIGSDTTKRLIKEFEEVDPTTTQRVSSRLGAILSGIWADGGIRDCYRRSSDFSFPDNALYFLENVTKFAHPDYVPDDHDILMARKPTLKVTETDFFIKNMNFRMIDVGGQKWLRPAWAVFFDDCKAILFVVSLAGYDQVVAEDPTENKMKDSLALFDMTCNHPLLKTVDIILLLNKVDLLEEKIKKSSVKKYFEDFNGKDETDLKQVKQYFKSKFLGLKKDNQHHIFIHSTTNTDTKLMKTVLNNVL